jgi:hypothetical protein
MSGAGGWLCRWLLLRHWHCSPECGWTGYRFSRSQFRERKRQIRLALLIMVLAVLGVATVWSALSRLSGRGGSAHDEGIQEAE